MKPLTPEARAELLGRVGYSVPKFYELAWISKEPFTRSGLRQKVYLPPVDELDFTKVASQTLRRAVMKLFKVDEIEMKVSNQFFLVAFRERAESIALLLVDPYFCFELARQRNCPVSEFSSWINVD
jgi:hypothetical protein